MDAAIPSVSQTAAPYFCTAGFQPALLFIPRTRPAHPLRHFRDLQHGVHLRANAFQLPFLLQPLHKLPQVRVRHCSLLSRRTLSRTSTHSPRCPPSLPQARECLPFDFLRPAATLSLLLDSVGPAFLGGPLFSLSTTNRAGSPRFNRTLSRNRFKLTQTVSD